MAEGDPRSLELGVGLCEAILSNEIMVKAADALQLLKSGSPFALVQVVELAEHLLARRYERRAGRHDAPSSGKR